MKEAIQQRKEEQKRLRSILRKALKKGTLKFRKTYHDFYDSCHPPVESPNAEWKVFKSHPTINFKTSDRMTIKALAENWFEGSMSYGSIRYEFKID